MTNRATQTTTQTFPFFSILALIFITLKLLGVIAWSWWLVLAPIWGPFAFLIVLFIVLVILAAIFGTR